MTPVKLCLGFGFGEWRHTAREGIRHEHSPGCLSAAVTAGIKQLCGHTACVSPKTHCSCRGSNLPLSLFENCILLHKGHSSIKIVGPQEQDFLKYYPKKETPVGTWKPKSPTWRGRLLTSLDKRGDPHIPPVSTLWFSGIDLTAQAWASSLGYPTQLLLPHLKPTFPSACTLETDCGGTSSISCSAIFCALAGEMALSEKYLLCKHEDLSSIP